MSVPNLQLLAARATILDKLEQIGIAVGVHESGAMVPVGAFEFDAQPFAYSVTRAPKLELNELGSVVSATCQYPTGSDCRVRSHVQADDLADVGRMLAQGLADWRGVLHASRMTAEFHMARRDRARAAFSGDPDAWRMSSVVCVPETGLPDTMWSVSSNAGLKWKLSASVPTSEMYRIKDSVSDLPFSVQKTSEITTYGRGIGRIAPISSTPAGKFEGEFKWAEDLLSKPVPPLPVIAKRFPGVRRMFEPVAKL